MLITIENITRAQVDTLKVYIVGMLSPVGKDTFVPSAPRVLVTVSALAPNSSAAGQDVPIRITYEDSTGAVREVEQDGTHTFRWTV